MTPRNGSPSVRRRPHVFLCGFIPRRQHSQSLASIGADLSPFYFLSTNPTVEQISAWNADLARATLRETQLFILLVNEFTLRDARCMTALYLARETHIPIALLRSPRARLLMNTTKLAIPRKLENASGENIEKAHQIIRSIFHEAMVYDRLAHAHSMHVLYKHISTVLHDDIPLPLGSRTPRGSLISPRIGRPLFPRIDDNTVTLEVSMRVSQGQKSGEQRVVSKGKKKKRGNGKSRSMSLEDVERTKSSDQRDTQTRVEQIKPPQTAATTELRLAGGLSAPLKSPIYESLLDGAWLEDTEMQTYRPTQYLMFHWGSKGPIPKLVSFPESMYDGDPSICGSESDMEQEEVDGASIIKGEIAPAISRLSLFEDELSTMSD